MGLNGQPSTRRGIVISDLHLLARRSHGKEKFDSLRAKLEDVVVLVLNGDIFDFHWSTLGRLDRSVPAAADWLFYLAADFQKCAIHYVVGNHDCPPAFLSELCRLAAELTRFQWHEYLLRLGPSLFFHGDFAHRQMDHHGLRRFRGKVARRLAVWRRPVCCLRVRRSLGHNPASSRVAFSTAEDSETDHFLSRSNEPWVAYGETRLLFRSRKPAILKL